AGAVVAEHADGHDRGIRCDTSGACSIRRGGDGAGDVRAVAVAIVGIVVAGGEIPAARVVDVAVAVIVEAIAGDLSGVDPQPAHQVGMVDVNTGVDDRDHDAVAGVAGGPGLGRIDGVEIPVVRTAVVGHVRQR